jgi:hypothetical protein
VDEDPRKALVWNACPAPPKQVERLDASLKLHLLVGSVAKAERVNVLDDLVTVVADIDEADAYAAAPRMIIGRTIRVDVDGVLIDHIHADHYAAGSVGASHSQVRPMQPRAMYVTQCGSGRSSIDQHCLRLGVARAWTSSSDDRTARIRDGTMSPVRRGVSLRSLPLAGAAICLAKLSGLLGSAGASPIVSSVALPAAVAFSQIFATGGRVDAYRLAVPRLIRDTHL